MDCNSTSFAQSVNNVIVDEDNSEESFEILSSQPPLEQQSFDSDFDAEVIRKICQENQILKEKLKENGDLILRATKKLSECLKENKQLKIDKNEMELLNDKLKEFKDFELENYKQEIEDLKELKNSELLSLKMDNENFHTIYNETREENVKLKQMKETQNAEILTLKIELETANQTKISQGKEIENLKKDLENYQTNYIKTNEENVKLKQTEMLQNAEISKLQTEQLNNKVRQDKEFTNLNTQIDNLKNKLEKSNKLRLEIEEEGRKLKYNNVSEREILRKKAEDQANEIEKLNAELSQQKLNEAQMKAKMELENNQLTTNLERSQTLIEQLNEELEEYRANHNYETMPLTEENEPSRNRPTVNINGLRRIQTVYLNRNSNYECPKCHCFFNSLSTLDNHIQGCLQIFRLS